MGVVRRMPLCHTGKLGNALTSGVFVELERNDRSTFKNRLHIAPSHQFNAAPRMGRNSGGDLSF